MNEADVIRLAAARGCSVYHHPRGLDVEGLGPLIVTDWPGSLCVLWILVWRAHPGWSPRRVAKFLRRDLKL